MTPATRRGRASPVRIPSLVLAASIGTTLAAPAGTVLAQGITAEQVAELQGVSAASVSPDGQRIVFSLVVPRGEEEERGGDHSRLYVVPFGGGEPTPLLPAGTSGRLPGWTPDGARATFVATLPEHHALSQVYAADPEAGPGSVERLTDSPTGVMAYALSPEGTRIAYTSRELLPDEVRERRARGWDMIVHGEDVQHVQLWTERAGGGERTPITPADRTVRDFAWSPDGERFALQVTDDPGADSDQMFRWIESVPATGGAPELLVETEGKLGPMAWSPDGARLAFLGARVYSDPLPQRVWLADGTGGAARDLTPEDYEGTPEWIGWLGPDRIVTAGVEGTRTAVNAWPVAGGGPARLLGGEDVGRGEGPVIVRSLSLADDRDRFAAPANTRRHPNEVFAGSLAAGESSRITHHNPWLEGVALGVQETIEWAGADGLRMEGVLTRPLGEPVAAGAPLAVLPHGGPEGISIDGWNTRPLYPTQFLAGHGYTVFKPNYRGSGGRGTAFASANHRDLGGKEFEDVLLGIDHLVEEGLADPDRVGMSGTSYGGYFAAWAGTRHSDRFRAAVTFAGLSNWISFFGSTDIPYEMADVHWDLWWFDNPGQHWDRSPVAWLEGASTPILVAQGLADERVHPEQSLQLHQFLVLKGIPTGLVLYPRQPHGLVERAHRIDFMERVLAWFDEHMAGG